MKLTFFDNNVVCYPIPWVGLTAGDLIFWVANRDDAVIHVEKVQRIYGLNVIGSSNEFNPNDFSKDIKVCNDYTYIDKNGSMEFINSTCLEGLLSVNNKLHMSHLYVGDNFTSVNLRSMSYDDIKKLVDK